MLGWGTSRGAAWGSQAAEAPRPTWPHLSPQLRLRWLAAFARSLRIGAAPARRSPCRVAAYRTSMRIFCSNVALTMAAARPPAGRLICCRSLRWLTPITCPCRWPEEFCRLLLPVCRPRSPRFWGSQAFLTCPRPRCRRVRRRCAFAFAAGRHWLQSFGTLAWSAWSPPAKRPRSEARRREPGSSASGRRAPICYD